MEGGLLGRLVYWGRTRMVLRLFGTRRREVDWVDRVLARKVASLTDTTFFCCTFASTLMYFQIGSKIPLISLQAHPHLFQSPL